MGTWTQKRQATTTCMPGHDPSRRNRQDQDQDQDEQSFSLSLSLCCTSTHSDRIDMNPACKRPSDKLSCFVLPFSCCFFWSVCPTLEYERRLLALFLKPPTVCVLVSFDLIFLQTAVLHFSLVLSGWPEDILKPVSL